MHVAFLSFGFHSFKFKIYRIILELFLLLNLIKKFCYISSDKIVKD